VYVALVVTEAILPAVFGGIHVGEKIEIKTFAPEVYSLHPRFAIGIELGEYFAVFLERVVHFAYEGIVILLRAVVVGASALVGAKFGVSPAGKYGATLGAFFLHTL
jgi:hypothetical protein